MLVNRFEQVLRYIHFVDYYSQEPGNAIKLFKVRTMSEALEKFSHSAVDPEEFQLIIKSITAGCGQVSQLGNSADVVMCP